MGGDKGSDFDRVVYVEPVVFVSFVFQVFECARDDEVGSHREKRERERAGTFLISALANFK